ncbi:MAG: hypothetical protein JSV03_12405 [Planctomycetota bacterium]|nr:MAG: hypothetical protein JSV03_12405 [Planctomycetota bacterium]
MGKLNERSELSLPMVMFAVDAPSMPRMGGGRILLTTSEHGAQNAGAQRKSAKGGKPNLHQTEGPAT